MKTRMPEYEIKQRLGSGCFGDVYLAKRKGRCYAIKKLRKYTPSPEREIEILCRVRHPNIIRYYEHYMKEERMCVVLEYADKGTFKDHVRAYGRPDEWEAWRFLASISDALDYLHSGDRRILHRDLKPDNILGVSDEDEIIWKLADFGIAKLLYRDDEADFYNSVSERGSTYMAPEVYDNNEYYSRKSDIWSLGAVMAFYLNKGQHPFYSLREVKEHLEDNPVFDERAYEKYSRNLRHLVLDMIHPRMKKRPTAEEILDETEAYDRQESRRNSRY